MQNYVFLSCFVLQELAQILFKAARECSYVNPRDVADILDASLIGPEAPGSKDNEKGNVFKQ